MRQGFKNHLIWIAVTLLINLFGCTLASRDSAFPIPKNRKPGLLRGVFHVHTEYSHDSKASLDLVIETARKAGLDFVAVTDHNNMKAREVYGTMKATDRPLVIIGTELSTRHGHLIAIGIKEQPPDIENTQEIINLIHKQGGIAILAHPWSLRKPWTNWNVEHFDGFEVFCFSDIFYSEGIRGLLPKGLFSPPAAFLKSVLKTSDSAFQFWDHELRKGRPVAAFGGTDAHLKWQWHGFTFENLLMSFQSVTMYVLADELKEETIIDSLAGGRSFIAFEAHGLAQDFSFSASSQDQTVHIGESISAQSPVLLTVQAPDHSQTSLIHDGKVIAESLGTALEVEAREAGTYRAEVYREGKLWIISNPIYMTMNPPSD